MSDDAITVWIAQLKEGEQEAAQRLWDQYFQRLVALARHRMGAAPRRVADEEDVALSVFNSLCRGAEQGNFSQLSNRDDLWRLLLTLTRQKAVDQLRYNTRRKRGGGDVRGESAFNSELGEGIDQFLAAEPTPEFLAALSEEHERLLGSLGSDETRQVAQLRMEGRSVQEISTMTGISTRSVERKLKLIREKWSRELNEQSQ